MTFAQNYLTAAMSGRQAYGQPERQQNALMQAPQGNFANALAMAESGGDYGAVNTLGYTGKYQFGEDRLTDFNRANGTNITLDQFNDTPEGRAIQDAVFKWHIADIDAFARDRGLTDRGFSMDQLRGVAHLGGKGGMARFVESGGAYNPQDAYGTSLTDYATRFR